MELVSILNRTLGDPDSTLPLLRSRSSAHKFDFKGRINELSAQNKALRSVLAEKRDGHRQLAETLSVIQQDMKWRLRSVADEAEHAKQRLFEQDGIASMLQEAVRAVWREEAPAAAAAAVVGGAGAAPGEGRQNPELQEQLAALRQCCAAEASRAALAEAVARQREEELIAMRHEMDELKGDRVRAHEKAHRATHLVSAAGAILNQQLAESKQQLMLAAGREQAFAQQLQKAQDRINDLADKLRATCGAGAGGTSKAQPRGGTPQRGMRLASPGGA